MCGLSGRVVCVLRDIKLGYYGVVTLWLFVTRGGKEEGEGITRAMACR